MTDTKGVARVLASGYIFDARAFDLISALPAELDVDSLVERLLEQKAALQSEAKVVTEEDVIKALPSGFLSNNGKEEVVPVEPADLEVLSDPTPAISPTPSTSCRRAPPRWG
jgi:hypothetical protein